MADTKEELQNLLIKCLPVLDQNAVDLAAQARRLLGLETDLGPDVGNDDPWRYSMNEE